MINIIIPCYNSRETLPKTLDSLVAQTQSRFFVTIVDDCSEEDIDDIVEEYSKRLNISYIRLEENGGSGAARQAGIDNNRMCEYLMFLDSDDMLMPQAIEVLNREANLHKPDILVSSFIQQNKYGINFKIKLDRNITWIHGKLYKASFLKEKNIRFPKDIRYNEDGSFNVMAFNMTKNIYKTSEITTLWVDNKNSLTRKNKNFDIICTPDFIRGQIYAYSFLLDNTKPKEEIIIYNIVQIYDFYQFLKFNNYIPEDIDIKIEKYLKRIEQLDYFKEKKYLKIFNKVLKQEKVTIDSYYFESETFLQWIKSYGVKFDENHID